MPELLFLAQSKKHGVEEAIGSSNIFSLSRQIILLSLFLYGAVLSSQIVITPTSFVEFWNGCVAPP